MDTQRISLLQAMPVFGAVRADILSVLLEAATVKTVEPGACFVRQGEQGSAMYVLEHGEVAVLKERDGVEVELTRMGPGDCFGEMSLVEPSTRSASVRAITSCTAICISSDDLFKVYGADVEQFAVIQMNLARELSRRLRDANERWFEKFGTEFYAG